MMRLQRERPFLLTLLVLVAASWAILIWQSRTTQGMGGGMGGGLTMGMGAALFLASLCRDDGSHDVALRSPRDPGRCASPA